MLDTRPYLDICFAYIFLVCVAFHSPNSVFQKAAVLNFDVQFINLKNLVDSAFTVVFKKTLSNPRSQRYSMFSSRSISVSGFTFRYEIHFELIFFIRYEVQIYVYFFCQWISNYTSTICWKNYLFSTELPPWNCLCQKSFVHICVGLSELSSSFLRYHSVLLDYFMLCFEIRSYWPSNFVLLKGCSELLLWVEQHLLQNNMLES